MFVLYRLYQQGMKLFAYLMPWRKPETLKGEGSVKKLAPVLNKKEIDKVLIITDEGLLSLGLLNGLKTHLDDANIGYKIYSETRPNPTIENIEDALKLYNEYHAQAIIAFGGGSPIDCAKGLAARVAKPHKKIPQLKGLLKVRKKIPLLIAIPTTSGSGSEATIAAVISNPEKQQKYAINDLSLIPHFAILDPSLTINLPRHITATTGLDALTHAVEAYIGKSNTKTTKQYSIETVKRVHQYLEIAYNNPTDLVARMNMQEAAHYAGLAFTRAYVGYVHAIAHTLGGHYDTPHGLANAVILPHVLTTYGKSIYKPLSELADAIKLTDKHVSKQDKAKAFIAWINNLNTKLDIPKYIDSINEKDISKMVQIAMQEAHPLYPVPKILKKQDLRAVYERIKA